MHNVEYIRDDGLPHGITYITLVSGSRMSLTVPTRLTSTVKVARLTNDSLQIILPTLFLRKTVTFSTTMNGCELTPNLGGLNSSKETRWLRMM